MSDQPNQYHINPDTGMAQYCRNPLECSRGEHAPSRIEAQHIFERMMRPYEVPEPARKGDRR